MCITRREFVGAAAVGGVMFGVPRPVRSLGVGRPTASQCTILDLDTGCSLPESLLGYRRAVAGVVPAAPTLILPASVTVPRRRIEAHLWRGGLVIFESGAGFLRGEAFEAHRGALRNVLGIHVGLPRVLWPRRMPYVNFHWPTGALVRDFSVVVPPVRRERDVVATADGMAVGVASRARLGHVLFLGSPLGPALWAGDADASRWLRAVLEWPGHNSA
jgi:hypothetical protein